MTTEARTPYTFDRIPAKARELLPQIGPTAYAVLGCLCAFADRDGKCWPSLATLCNMMGVTKPTLCRALADLERYRLIARERQKANTNTRYKIAFPPCDSPGRVVTLTTPASNASVTPGCNASVTWGVTPAIHEPYSLNQTQDNQTHRTTSDAAFAAGEETEKPPVSSTSKKPEASELDHELAKWFWDRINATHPDQRKPNLDKWADAFRLLRERDNRTADRIREVAAWALADSFWSTNILSPIKLRKQFGTLAAKMAKPPITNKSKYTGANSLFTPHKEGTHGDF